MKKLIGLLLITMLLCTGCGTATENTNKLLDKVSPNTFNTTSSNSVIQQAQDNAPDDALLYIINSPTEDELDQIISYQVLKLSDTDDVTLLVPRRKGTAVAVYTVSYDEETGKYERGGEIWSTDSSDKGLVISAQILRGENGHPTYELYVERDNYFASYYFEMPAADQDGNAELEKFEYVTKQGEISSMSKLD